MGRAVVFALIAVCLLAWPAMGEPRSLTIVYPPEKNAFHDAAAEIIQAAYRRLDIEVRYKTFPAERALKMSNGGVVDGELVRILGIDKMYPNLIRVPISHVTAEQVAFGSASGIKIDGWASLAPYRIAFHRGYKAAENNTVGMNRFLTGTDVAAFRMVDSGRMDLALANRFTGAKIIEEMKFETLRMLTPPVQVDPLFHYLHEKHRDLVPKITGVLRRMKSDGEFARVKDRLQVAPLAE